MVSRIWRHFSQLTKSTIELFFNRHQSQCSNEKLRVMCDKNFKQTTGVFYVPIFQIFCFSSDQPQAIGAPPPLR
jgi:hypothetical protein